MKRGLLLVVLFACGGGAQSGAPANGVTTETHATPPGGPRATLDALVAELKGTPNVAVSEATIAPPASRADLDAVKQRLHVSDKLLATWAAMNGATIEWRGPNETVGSIEIPPVAEAFADGKGRVYQDDDPPDDPKRKFYVIDKSDPGTGGSATGIVVDGSDDPAVFYLEDGHELKPLGVKLDGYVALVAKARGFGYWQEAVVVDVSGERESTIEPRQFRILAPKVFSHLVLGDVLHRDYAGDRAKVDEARATIAKVEAQLSKEHAKGTFRARDAMLGELTLEIPKDAANVQAVERALGPEWKGKLKGAGSVSIGEMRVELR